MQHNKKVLWFLLAWSTALIIYFYWRQMVQLQNSELITLQSNTWTAYSSHICQTIFEPELLTDKLAPHLRAMRRKCIMQNVCYQGGKFVYFKNSESLLTFEQLPYAEMSTTIPFQIVSMAQHEITFQERIETIPHNATWLNTKTGYHVLWRLLQFEAHNIGHILGDGVKPVFLALMEYEWHQRKEGVQVWTPFTCETMFPTNSNDSANCQKLKTQMYSILSPHKPRALQELNAEQLYCFPKLMVLGEQARTVFQQQNDHPGAWRRFREFVYHNLQIVKSPRKKLQITVRYKPGLRHSFLNHNDIIKVLKAKYPYANVLDYYGEKMKPGEEIQLLADTDIFISPPGGGTFPMIFMQDHSVQIIGNLCFPCASAIDVRQLFFINGTEACCRKLEGHVWSKVSHLHVLYYRHENRTTLECHVDACKRPNQDMWQFLAWSYHVDVSILTSLVDEGIEYIKQWRKD